jgi:hypothetical protein
MITVWSGSAAFRWRIRATKAFLSASSVAGKCGDSEFLTSPLALITRGKRLLSSLTHSGAYCGPLFFQVPNHSRTSFTSFSRACSSSTSTYEKSNWPSTGSICSQATGISRVLACRAFTAGHTLGSCEG